MRQSPPNSVCVYTHKGKGVWVLTKLRLRSLRGQGHTGKVSKAQVIITLLLSPLYILVLFILRACILKRSTIFKESKNYYCTSDMLIVGEEHNRQI